MQFDKKWNNDPGFVFYDYNEPENVPPELLNSFDMVVIDPPFITREVWEKYATTAKILMKKGVDDAGVWPVCVYSQCWEDSKFLYVGDLCCS